MRPDWTLNAYECLCLALLDTGRPLLGVREFLDSRPKDAVILRHDVDRFPANAEHMAELETRLGVRSTYYVRVTRHPPKPALLERLHELGHEVGYHYEVLAKTGGDTSAARDLFRRELELLRTHVPVETVAPHGSPLSRWDSLRIWDGIERSELGVTGDAYLDIDFASTSYLTDTGRTWAETASNLRDRPTVSGPGRQSVRSTDELIGALPLLGAAPLCLQTHPERWNETVLGYLRSWLLDLGAHGAKRLIRIARPNHVRNRARTGD